MSEWLVIVLIVGGAACGYMAGFVAGRSVERVSAAFRELSEDEDA